jgi:hypothetical protein
LGLQEKEMLMSLCYSLCLISFLDSFSSSPKSPDSFLSYIQKKLFTEDIFYKGKEDEMSCLKVRVHARLSGNEEMKTNEKTPLRRGRDIPFQ